MGRQRWWRRGWVFGWLGLAVALVIVVAYAVSLFRPVHPHSRQTRYFTVRAGQSAASVANALHNEGLIRSALAFEVWSRVTGLSTHLTAGVYRVSPHDGVRAILRRMIQGDVVIIHVSVPPGLTVQEIAMRLSRSGIGTLSQYRVLERSPLHGMPKPAPGVRDPLEGYLYPATYAFSPTTTAKEAFMTMWTTFESREEPVYRASHSSLTLAQWVSLASVVQEEDSQVKYAPDIAAVFLNRQRLGMLWQSDATVRYALNNPSAQGLDLADLKVSSPYNTYQHAGFPPGPICNPGAVALNAALHPAPVKFLYFLSLRSGKVLFATTYSQHLANISYANSHPNA